jgi:hypothetical protein
MLSSAIFIFLQIHVCLVTEFRGYWLGSQPGDPCSFTEFVMHEVIKGWGFFRVFQLFLTNYYSKKSNNVLISFCT